MCAQPEEGIFCRQNITCSNILLYYYAQFFFFFWSFQLERLLKINKKCIFSYLWPTIYHFVFAHHCCPPLCVCPLFAVLLCKLVTKSCGLLKAIPALPFNGKFSFAIGEKTIDAGDLNFYMKCQFWYIIY